MYQLKKTVPFEDDIQLLNESGEVVHTIHVSLRLDDLLGKYNETVNALKAAEAGADPDVEATLETYGNAVMSLLRLIFSEDADTILNHYDGRYLEMLDNILPYIFTTIGPELRKLSRNRMGMLKAARS